MTRIRVTTPEDIAATAVVDPFTQLATAKHNVQWLLDHPDGSVDFHGLAYWAGVVERLRTEIRKGL
jgi:hypothetical protein